MKSKFYLMKLKQSVALELGPELKIPTGFSK
jgi:hypothetical protein